MSYRNRVIYEWLVDELNGDGDIVDTQYYDTFYQAVAAQWAALGSCSNGNNYEVGLIRYVGNDVDGEVDRQYAYTVCNELPEFFDGGAKVPVRFHCEITNWRNENVVFKGFR